MLRIILCDDDVHQRGWIADAIRAVAAERGLAAEIVAETVDSDSFRFAVSRNAAVRRPEDRTVCFLDIGLGEKNSDGFLLAAFVREHEPEAYIVFVTSFREHIRRGYQYRAYDYIIKTSEAEMKKEIRQALVRIAQDAAQTNRAAEEQISLKQHNGYRVVRIAELIGVSRSPYGYVVHCTFGDIPYYDGLSVLARRLSAFPQIVRCHQSALINVDHVREVLTNRRALLTDDGRTIPVARRRLKEVLAAIESVGSR